MRLLLALILAFSFSKAQAASLTITLSGSGIVNGSKTFAISDADLQRLLTVYGNRMKNDAGQIPPNGQVLQQWIQMWITETINNIKADEAAAQTPAPITVQ